MSPCANMSLYANISPCEYVTLSEAKGLCVQDRILRFAQNDRTPDNDFAIVLAEAQGLSIFGLIV